MAATQNEQFEIDPEEFQQIDSINLAWEDCLSLDDQQRREDILRIQALLEEPGQTSEKKAKLFFEQAFILQSIGDDERAIISYDQALQLEPDDHHSWYNRGYSLDNLGRYEEAISSYDNALQLKPDEYEIWYNRGNSLAKLRRYEEALISYDQALQLKFDADEVWYGRGYSLDNLGRYEEAISSYDNVLQLKPDDYRVWNNRGHSLGSLERYEEAILSYNKALEFAPNFSNAFYGQACCYSLQNETDFAIAPLQQAIVLNPKYREMAKTASAFDKIRNDDRFQALINGTESESET